MVGCEEDAGDTSSSGSFVSRDVLSDGTVVLVYQQTVVSPSNTMLTVTTTITQPAGGLPVTNITYTPVGGAVAPGATNAVSSAPANHLPLLRFHASPGRAAS
jgi:hypothetical protein